MTPGGVVLGADSTQTFQAGDILRHYNHAQKLFEAGEDSTLGLITWGYGGGFSYRRAVADFSDGLKANAVASVGDAAARWVAEFFPLYTQELADLIKAIVGLQGKPNRTPEEDEQLRNMVNGGIVGFCLGGYVLPSREPEAYSILFNPVATTPPAPLKIQAGQPQFWGVPNIMHRVTRGIDVGLFNDILASPHWTGSDKDLMQLIAPHVLAPPSGNLPIREAIDLVYSTILTTCKGLKFSATAPICGGPIEVAVITTDRRFRWVTHKDMGRAVQVP